MGTEKRIVLSIRVDSDNNMYGVCIEENTTDLISDHLLIKRIAAGLVISINNNIDKIAVQDLLSNTGVTIKKN